MSKHTVRATCGGVLVGFSVLALAFPASAAPLNLLDKYYGGLSTYGGMTDDTIENPGTHAFEISSADISRSGNTLTIAINTNFAGVPGTGPADGTGYGSLFLTPGTWHPTGSGPNFTADQYT